MNGGRGQAGLIASPSVDLVQEVNIVRNQFDAQFGKSEGGGVNMITRGGQNDFFGVIQSGALAGATVPRHRLLRPHPQYTRREFQLQFLFGPAGLVFYLAVRRFSPEKSAKLVVK